MLRDSRLKRNLDDRVEIKHTAQCVYCTVLCNVNSLIFLQSNFFFFIFPIILSSLCNSSSAKFRSRTSINKRQTTKQQFVFAFAFLARGSGSYVEFQGNRRALRTLYDCSVPSATSIKGAAKLMSFRHNLRDICMKYYGYLVSTIVGFFPVSLASLVFVMLLITKKITQLSEFLRRTHLPLTCR